MAGVGSWSQDVASGRCEWSRQAYRIFGIEIGTLVDYPTFLNHVHPEDLILIQQGWQSAAEGARVHDEQQLRESEERFRKLFEDSR